MDYHARKKIAASLRNAAHALRADYSSFPHFKNKWKTLTLKQVRSDPKLQEELFELVHKAYKSIGGHINLRRPIDLVKGEITLFQVIDTDHDAGADAVVLIKNKKAGEKHVGMGHDGTKKAKNEIIKHKVDELKHTGVFAEVSDAIAHVFLTRYDVHTVDNEDDVRKVLPGKDIEWVGAHPSGKYADHPGWYYRSIGGHKHLKIIVGRPKI